MTTKQAEETAAKGPLSGVSIGPLEEPVEDDETVIESPSIQPEARTALAAAEQAAPPSTPAATVTPTTDAPAAKSAEQPPTTPTTPTTPSVNYEAMQRRLAELEKNAAAGAQAEATAKAQREDDAEVSQYKAHLEQRGFTPEDTEVFVKEKREMVQARRSLGNQIVGAQYYYDGLEQRMNAYARDIIVRGLSAQYGMPVEELMKFSDPNVMEAKAEAYKERKAREADKQAAVKPLHLAGTSPSSARPSTYEAIRDRYVEGKPLTAAERQVLFPGR